ncbi:MAG: hypothetical protein EBS48_05190, partial [Actinobacteria bacterium]|nr:hypothetical protein [Actinomycetota bacterium]
MIAAVTMSGALTAFRDAAAAAATSSRGARAAAAPPTVEERQAAAARLAAAGVSRDLAPIGTTVAGKVGRSSGALGANALRPPSST